MKKILAFLSFKALGELFVLYVLPLAIPTVSTIAMYFINQNPVVLWLVFIITAYFTIQTYLSIDEWYRQNKVQDKLAFQTLHISTNMHGEGIVAQIQLQNFAPFPLYFTFTDFTFHLDNASLNSEEDYSSSAPIMVPPYGIGFKNSLVMNIRSNNHEEVIKGTVSYTFRYGRFSILKHSFSGKLHVFVKVSENGDLLNFGWGNA